MPTSDDTLERVRRATEAELRTIAAGTGLPKPTLDKIRYGVTRDPRTSTVRKLQAYFDSADCGLERPPDEHPTR